MPNIGESIDPFNYPNVLCSSVRPEEIDEGNYANWKVRVTYETSTDTPIDPTQDPVDAPAVVSGGSLRRSIALDLAYKDDREELPTKAIVNSLGDVFDPPVVDEKTHTATQNKLPTNVGGVWTLGWLVEEKSEQEKEAYRNAKAASVRRERDALLAATDWRALSDVTLSQEWATYRQQLRDITEQAGFPFDVVFPVKPSA